MTMTSGTMAKDSIKMDAIGTALLAAAIKASAGPVINAIKSLGSEAYDTLVSQFQEYFQGHVENTSARCSKMKNILYRDQSVEFFSQYVNILFSQSDNKIGDYDALSQVVDGSKLLVCGTAGAGKTMFMRWLSLELIEGMGLHGRVPLYLEMRYFDESFEDAPLSHYIHERTSSIVDASAYSVFECGLKNGLFIILLDAIDELKPSLRDKVVGKILEFLREYPLCGVCISSRFDEKLECIQDFSVLRVMPMVKSQIINVIEKLAYDADVKGKLIGRLNAGLYEQLKEFLSNPLLATIMLLTFDHAADVPTKLTAFYQQAFETLYQRHDAAKGAFKRDHYAGLPLHRFQAVFSTFCFQTYLDYKFEFSDVDLASAFAKACEYNQDDSNVDFLIKDSMQSVCLMQRDGLYNVFSHRSFQEYFCALFVSNYREDNVHDIIEAIASIEKHPNVIRMLYELSPEVFEYEWVLPLIEQHLKKFERVRFDTKTGLRKIFAATFGEIAASTKDGTIRLMSWTSGGTISLGHAARWQSVIETATNREIRAHTVFFQKSKIWTNIKEFLRIVPENVRPNSASIKSKIEEMKKHHAIEQSVILIPSDSSWLIYSGLPLLFEKQLDFLKKYRDDIVLRRSKRIFAIEPLLKKTKDAPFRR
jgi:hypothetical protein